MSKVSKTALLLLATICVTYFVENFFRTAASALTPILIEELSISRASMGLLITAFFLIYGFMQFPAGLLTEILGPKKSIVLFTALTIVGGVLFWASYSYELLFAAQFIMGIGTSVFYLNAITLLSRWIPSSRRATAIGILSASSGMGAFTCFIGFPLAITIWGTWRNLYLVMLGALLVNWVFNYFLIKDNPSNTTSVIGRREGLFLSLKRTLGEKALHPLFFGYAMMGLNYLLIQWANQYLIESKSLTYVEAGLVTSVGTVSGFIGCIAMGVFSDKIKKRKLPIIASLTLYTVFLGCFIFLPSGLPVAFYALNWFLLTFFLSFWVLFPSMVGEVVSRAKATIGFGVMNGLMMIITSLATPLYGALVDLTGSFFIPTLISLGLSVFALIILNRSLSETYGLAPGD